MEVQAEPRGEFNIVHVREGDEGETPHRRIIAPDQDYSMESEGIQAICGEAFTDEIKASYQAFITK
jgi:hypothetical protein